MPKSTKTHELHKTHCTTPKQSDTIKRGKRKEKEIYAKFRQTVSKTNDLPKVNRLNTY